MNPPCFLTPLLLKLPLLSDARKGPNAYIYISCFMNPSKYIIYTQHLTIYIYNVNICIYMCIHTHTYVYTHIYIYVFHYKPELNKLQSKLQPSKEFSSCHHCKVLASWPLPTISTFFGKYLCFRRFCLEHMYI